MSSAPQAASPRSGTQAPIVDETHDGALLPATAQGETCHKSDGSSQNTPPLPTSKASLVQLPPELLLEIASHLRWPDASFALSSLDTTPFILHHHSHNQNEVVSSERQLLKLRLLSRDLGNLVALEPSFWHEIHFNKKTYLQSSSRSTQPPSSVGTNPSTATAHHPSLYSYVHIPPFQYTTRPVRPFHGLTSDANLMAHRESWADAMLKQPGLGQRTSLAGVDNLQKPIDPAAGASLFMSTPRLATFNQGATELTATQPQLPSSLSEASTDANKSSAVRWKEKFASLVLFMELLVAKPAMVEGLHRVVIEDISERTMVQELWRVLTGMPALKELSLRRSDGLVSLNQCFSQLTAHDTSVDVDHPLTQKDHNQNTSTPLPPRPRWYHLTSLDLTGSVQLRDIRGIRDAMPALNKVVLEGCRGIDNFRPLVRVGYCGGSIQPQSTGSSSEDQQADEGTPQPSPLQTLILSQTMLKDRDLIEIVQYSRGLRELRVDQCYQLTIDSLMAIGRNQIASEHVDGLAPISTLAPSTSLSAPSATTVANTPPSMTTTTATTTTPSRSMCPDLRTLSLKGCWDLQDEGVRALVGCPRLELLFIRGLRLVREETVDWLHDQGVPLRKVLSPLGHWRHYQV